jgi:membrane-bound metal-dependent hydrolase YbcI (DUF457 family)
MLGKDHVSITIGTVLPFIIPMIISDHAQPVYALCILITALIGSLMPDADSEGKSALYYDFRIVYYVMRPLYKLIVFCFRLFNIKEKMNLEYAVEEKHRGVMHSPIGVLISSLVLTTLLAIADYAIFNEINTEIIGLLFLGLMAGQFLHLLEDSCTVSGINWLFPFGTLKLKGSIYTGTKVEGKTDIRPFFYNIALLFFSAALVIFHFMGQINLKDPDIYSFIFAGVTLIWLLILLTAKINYDKLWLKDTKKVRKLEKSVDNIVPKKFR